MGITKRPHYKRERRPARIKGVVKQGSMAPVSAQDANADEICHALASMCREAGVTIGRAAAYDPLKDVYTVVGRSQRTGKAQDFTIQGAEVGQLIALMRMLNGGKLERGGRTAARFTMPVG